MNYLMKNNYLIPKDLAKEVLKVLRKKDYQLYCEFKGEIDSWQDEKIDKKYILDSKSYWDGNFEVEEIKEGWWQVKNKQNSKAVNCTSQLMAYKLAFICQEVILKEPKLIYKFRNYTRIQAKVKYLLGMNALRYFR